MEDKGAEDVPPVRTGSTTTTTAIPVSRSSSGDVSGTSSNGNKEGRKSEHLSETASPSSPDWLAWSWSRKSRKSELNKSNHSEVSSFGPASGKRSSNKKRLNASSADADGKDSSRTHDHSIRLHPAVTKKMKLHQEGASVHVVDLMGETGAAKALKSPTDNDNENNSIDRLKLGQTSERSTENSGLFSGMGIQDFFDNVCHCFRNSTSTGDNSDREESLPSASDSELHTAQELKMPPKRASLWQVSLYLTNDTIGAWLTLYGAVILAMYGYITGLLILVLAWPLNVYTAHLLWRCRNVFPGAISIGDLVYYLTRSHAAMYTAFFFVNITILGTLAFQIEAAAANVYWFFSNDLTSGGHCYVVFLAGVCLIVLPLVQLRYLHNLTFMNIINVSCLLVFVCVMIYMLSVDGVVPGAVTRVGLNEKYLFTLSDIGDESDDTVVLFGVEMVFFGYYYQLIVLEIIAEMKDPSEFPKANYWSTPVIIFVAVACSVSRYYFQGEEEVLTDSTSDEILHSIFDYGERVRAAYEYVGVVCFSVHMIGCCVIRALILTRSMHLLLHPSAANKRTWKSRFEWTGISVVVIALAWLITLGIKSAGLMTLFLGFLALFTSIVLPIALYIQCCRRTKTLKKVPIVEWILIAFILLLSVFTFVAYFYNFALKIANNKELEIDTIFHTNWGDLFSCHNVSDQFSPPQDL